MGDKRATPTAVKQLGRWIRSRSVRQQVSMASMAALFLLVFLKLFVRNYTYFYLGAQLSHAIGILVLIYKLTITKTCSGLSLKTQELTAVFLVMRVVCHFMLIRDIYVVLDFITLGSTLWLVPSAIVALIGHPGFGVNFGFRFFYMYSKIIEAVSVLPQLRLIQNAKMVEPFTAHYVFALGVARFLACANWIIMLIDTKGALLTQIGNGNLYILVVLLAEVVQTFILADFCYYYIKSCSSNLSLAMKTLEFVNSFLSAQPLKD
ncbi:ER lumen protein-retaining receptor [Bienertia sinuspersici]